MQPGEVFAALRMHGMGTLFHANTVRTSHSILRARGLMSRAATLGAGYPMSVQYTDALDQSFGIFNDIFFDSVDIHRRASNRNLYGPVVFSISIEVLNNLPVNSEVFVYKLNPTKWYANQDEGERMFLTSVELQAGFQVGTFDQMIVIRTPGGYIPFANFLTAITLDNPQRQILGVDIFNNAQASLMGVANGVQVLQRQCMFGCKCAVTYGATAEQQLQEKFSA